jgi:hypothetical protein
MFMVLIALLATPILAHDPDEQNAWKCHNEDRKCLAGESVGICHEKAWYVIENCPGP